MATISDTSDHAARERLERLECALDAAQLVGAVGWDGRPAEPECDGGVAPSAVAWAYSVRRWFGGNRTTDQETQRRWTFRRDHAWRRIVDRAHVLHPSDRPFATPELRHKLRDLLRKALNPATKGRREVLAGGLLYAISILGDRDCFRDVENALNGLDTTCAEHTELADCLAELGERLREETAHDTLLRASQRVPDSELVRPAAAAAGDDRLLVRPVSAQDAAGTTFERENVNP